MLGLELPYYLGHEGKKFSGGKSKSNVFKFTFLKFILYNIAYFLLDKKGVM